MHGRGDRDVRPAAACTARSRSATTGCAARSRASRGSRPTPPRRVLHIILSHHGSLEHGSPVVPCTREATLVHMIDNLGGRLGQLRPAREGRCPPASSGPRTTRGSAAGRSSPPRPSRSAARPEAPSALRRRRRPRPGHPPGASRRDGGLQICANSAGAGAARSRRPRSATRVRKRMAKDTEKLIRQLSLISYLMAERRPVTAPEIRRDVEGYSVMNEDAFARRFYADRSELEALGIVLAVEKPVDGLVEQENYSLPPENFHLPRDRVHRPGAGGAADRAAAARRRVRLRRAAAAGAAADLLGAAQPARRRRSRTRSRSGSPARPAVTTSRSGWPRSRPRSSAARRSCSTTTRWSATRSARGASTPTSCSTRAVSSTSSAARTSAARSGSSGSRGSAARSATRPRPSTTSSARRTSTRAPTPTGSTGSSATRWAPPRCGSASGSRGRSSATSAATARSGRPATTASPATGCSSPRYANSRQLIAWALGLGENARIVGPPELVAELRDRVALLIERHTGEPQVAAFPAGRRARRRPTSDAQPRRSWPTATRATATGPTPRSGPSASPAWSRWPAS